MQTFDILPYCLPGVTISTVLSSPWGPLASAVSNVAESGPWRLFLKCRFN